MTPSKQSCDSLLLQFANELEVWNTYTAAGMAAVAALQQNLDSLVFTAPSQEAMKIYERLMDMAPSFQLEKYIQQQQRPAATPSDAAECLHAAVNKLQTALTSARESLDTLSSIATQYQDAVLSEPLQQIHLTAAPDTDVAVELSAAEPASPASGPDTTEQQESAGAARPPALQPEELALLMSTVVSGMQQDLQWMESAATGITLNTSTEELSTLSTLWELQPFTNEQAVASLLTAAETVAQ